MLRILEAFSLDYSWVPLSIHSFNLSSVHPFIRSFIHSIDSEYYLMTLYSVLDSGPGLALGAGK